MAAVVDLVHVVKDLDEQRGQTHCERAWVRMFASESLSEDHVALAERGGDGDCRWDGSIRHADAHRSASGKHQACRHAPSGSYDVQERPQPRHVLTAPIVHPVECSPYGWPLM